MLNSLTPFIVAIYSICMLNADLFVHNYIAFIFVIIGSILVMLAGFLDFSGGNKNSNSTYTSAENGFAFIILIISILLTAL